MTWLLSSTVPCASTTTASIGPPPPHLPHHSHPGLPPGFPPGLAGFPRPGLPGGPTAGLPPMLFGPGGLPPNPQIPREYPLYPWFISRRFPGGKLLFSLIYYYLCHSGFKSFMLSHSRNHELLISNDFWLHLKKFFFQKKISLHNLKIDSHYLEDFA